MIRYLIVACMVLLLLGCRTVSSADPAYIIPAAGGQVRIDQRLMVPGGQTRVFLQKGRMVSKLKLDRYYPSCNFEVWSLSQDPTVIHPGSFVITQADRGADMVVSLEPMRVAGLRWHPHDDDHSMIMHVVHMRLQSAQQPNVYRLTCRGWLAVPAEARRPTLADMREALGRLASIRLRGE